MWARISRGPLLEVEIEEGAFVQKRVHSACRVTIAVLLSRLISKVIMAAKCSSIFFGLYGIRSKGRKCALAALVLLSIATGIGFGSYYFWLIRPLCCALRGHQGALLCVCISEDSKTIATGGADGALILWDLASFSKKAMTHGHSQPITAILFSHTGGLVASASEDGDVCLWDQSTMKRMSHFRRSEKTSPSSQTALPRSLAFAPNDKILAVGWNDGTISLWDLELMKVSGSLQQQDGPICSLAFSESGVALAARSEFGDTILWDVKTKGLIFKTDSVQHRLPFRKLTYVRRGQLIAINDNVTDKISLLEAATGAPARALRASSDWQDSPIRSFDTTLDDRYLIGKPAFGLSLYC